MAKFHFDGFNYKKFDGDRPEKDVERKETVDKDGRHKIEITLAVDSKEAQKAVGIFCAGIEDIHKTKEPDKLADKIQWLSGYIGGIYTTNAISSEQADELTRLLVLAAKTQAKVLGYGEQKKK